MAPDHRLLILSCSERKRSEPDLLPAIERYDGPPFRVLRKFLRERLREAQSLDIFILSAEFGLIPAGHPIPYYDHRMTPGRAHDLQPLVLYKLKEILDGGRYHELFISVGRDYLQALAGYSSLIPGGLRLILSTGTQGRKLGQLRDWLYGSPPMLRPKQDTSLKKGHARIRGIEITMTSQQVLDVARQALVEGRGDPVRYQGWYVQVDDQRAAPKWLVSQLTGLPVSAFVTGEARRILEQLGIELVRV